MFVIRNVTTLNGKTHYRVSVRSWALGGGDRMVGWIEAPTSAAQPAGPRPATSVAALTPTLDLTAPTGTDFVVGEIVSIDTDARTITVRQGSASRTVFAYRDDSTFEGTLGIPVRFDDFADSNSGRLPVTARDKVQITWRMSQDGKTPILSTIKKAQ